MHEEWGLWKSRASPDDMENESKDVQGSTEGHIT